MLARPNNQTKRFSNFLKISLILVTLGFFSYKFVLPVFETYTLSGSLLGTATLSAPTATPHPSFEDLSLRIQSLLLENKVEGSVVLIELGGNDPQSWSWQAEKQFIAASTYKLPLLMREAEILALGETKTSDQLCFQGRDYEPGYFGDYAPGKCYSRAELARRAGKFSDNTAAHILVRYAGGDTELNRYTKEHGAVGSKFYDPNTTTCNDLAKLWQSEYQGNAGGKTAQDYLYPYLTNTYFEAGIPAGLPSGVKVIHKIGILGSTIIDAALVLKGPSGDYILSICTKGTGGWGILAKISQVVWEFEKLR